MLLNSKYNHNIGLLDSTIVFIYLNLWLYDLRKSHISSVDLHSQSLHLYGVAANILFFSIFLPTWNQCWDKWGTCLLCGVVGAASGHLGGTQIIPASLTSNINWFLLENNLITSEKLSPNLHRMLCQYLSISLYVVRFRLRILVEVKESMPCNVITLSGVFLKILAWWCLVYYQAWRCWYDLVVLLYW